MTLEALEVVQAQIVEDATMSEVAIMEAAAEVATTEAAGVLELEAGWTLRVASDWTSAGR